MLFSSPFSLAFAELHGASPEVGVLLRCGVFVGGREVTALGLKAASWSITRDKKSSCSLASGKLLEGLSSIRISGLSCIMRTRREY